MPNAPCDLCGTHQVRAVLCIFECAALSLFAFEFKACRAFLPFNLAGNFIGPREELLLRVDPQGLDGLHDTLEPLAHRQLLIVREELTYALLLVLARITARQPVHQRQQGRRVLFR